MKTKTKTAYLVRYSLRGAGVEAQTAGRNLRTFRAACRGAKTLRILGYGDVWIGSVTVSADTVLRK